jgi:hypothetical protein
MGDTPCCTRRYVLIVERQVLKKIQSRLRWRSAGAIFF